MADVRALNVRFCYLIALGAAALVSGPVRAEQSYQFDIGQGSLGSVLIALGRQGSLSIGMTDAGLASRRSKGVHGRHSVKEALRIALRATGADFAFVDANTVRVFAVPPQQIMARAKASPRADPPTNGTESEIVVTASKQSTLLSRYPATVTVLDLNGDQGSRDAARGTAILVERLPMLAATDLGPGRNKLFVRGVADSSFNGGSQATVGQYLGEARLTFNAPDPNLNLYDIGRVEIVEGPQGTLYGTGAIGGIVRLVPNLPDPTKLTATAAAGLTATHHGAPGGDAATMVNLPVRNGTLALRGVLYATEEGGYIDDPSRAVRNINRTVTGGGRLAMRWTPADDWTVDAGLAVQNITSDDGQYSLRGQSDLTRTSRIAQPFDNDYRMAFVTLAHASAGAKWTSTTSVVRHDIDTVYDATGFDGSPKPSRFSEHIGITLVSHETRISGGGASHPWLGGISGVYDISRVSRSLGDPLAPAPISGVRNETGEIAAFGQYGFPVADHLQLTVGARATYTRTVGALIDDPQGEIVDPRRESVRVSPSLALAWQPRDRLLLFARFEHGSRAGGLAVSPTGSALDAKRFASDTLMAGELGARFGQRDRDRFWASATVSYARWTNIQADLIDSIGLPYTTNIGDGHIAGLEAQAGWRPAKGLSVDGALFVNSSVLTAPAPAFASAQERELPNIAGTGARVSARYDIDISPRSKLTLDGTLRYVGRSQLGIGTPFELPQGDYATARIGLRVATEKLGFSLDIDNLADVRGNRFAYGNPFGAALGNQITPLRPRNVRVGIDAKF